MTYEPICAFFQGYEPLFGSQTLDPHQSEANRFRIKVTNRIRIRIRIKVMRIRNTGLQYRYRYLRYGTPRNVSDAFCINFVKFGH